MSADYTASKRISQINDLNLSKVVIDDQTNLAYEFKDGWDHWFIETDTKNATTGEDISLRVPVDRLVYRDPGSGIIYTYELPSYVDDMVYGHLDLSTSGKAVFVTDDYETVDPDKRRLEQYVSPDNYTNIPTQTIFVETDPNAGYQTKYIYVPSMRNADAGVCKFGFIRISRSEITPSDWVDIEGDDEYRKSEREVRVVKANTIEFNECNTSYDISKTGNGVFIDEEFIHVVDRTGDIHPDPNNPITVSTDNNVITISNLSNTCYKIGLSLVAKRKVSSPAPVYAELKLAANSTVIATTEIDMAMLSGDYQTVNMVGIVPVSNNTLTLRLTSEGGDLSITVKCVFGYIAELI